MGDNSIQEQLNRFRKFFEADEEDEKDKPEKDEKPDEDEDKDDKSGKDDDKDDGENSDEVEDDSTPSEDDAIDASEPPEEGDPPPEVSDDDEIDLSDTSSDEGEEGEDSSSIMDDLSVKIKLSKNELSICDSLIESETDAISDYSKALNETKNRFARKLYTEILSDESKHLSQLKYLKSMGSDEDYVPKDKEAIDELAGILESVLMDTTEIL